MATEHSSATRRHRRPLLSSVTGAFVAGAIVAGAIAFAPPAAAQQRNANESHSGCLLRVRQQCLRAPDPFACQQHEGQFCPPPPPERNRDPMLPAKPVEE